MTHTESCEFKELAPHAGRNTQHTQRAVKRARRLRRTAGDRSLVSALRTWPVEATLRPRGAVAAHRFASTGQLHIGPQSVKVVSMRALFKMKLLLFQERCGCADLSNDTCSKFRLQRVVRKYWWRA